MLESLLKYFSVFVKCKGKIMSVKSVFYQTTLALMLASISYSAAAETIYAAASMTDAINELKAKYEKKHNVKVKTSYAASSTLARQIEQGASADVFISADLAWMDYLENKGKVSATHRKNLLGNRLVLITPVKNPIKTNIKFDKNFNVDAAFTGKLCTGNTNSVPVGKYAKQALNNLNWWSSISKRLVETEDVRAALNFVSRGECQLGIVYATDAAASKNVKVVGTFPLATHNPIVYPIGMINTDANSKRFYEYLQSNEAKAVYKKHGFSVLQ